MKGDFSRFVEPARARQRGVLLQQGRAPLDSDWAAHFAMRESLVRTQLADLVGHAGVPRGAAGFGVETANGELMLTAGRCYVDGILCETDRMPLHDAPKANSLAYLEVWQHTRGLHGSDALAVEAVWRVRFTTDDREHGPASGPWHPPDRRPSSARLEVRASHPEALAPQLYRVEIHDEGEKDERRGARRTWKWSRNNAATTFPLAGIVPSERNVVVEVGAPARQVALRLKPGQWLELVDEAAELRQEARPLWQVAGVEPTRDPRVARIALIRSAAVELPYLDPAHPPLLRAWDHQGAPRAPLTAGALPLVADEWIPLERGIEVRFRTLDEEEPLVVHPGAYWVFATRPNHPPAWPGGATATTARPPAGIERVYARLARIAYERGAWRVARDLRQLFDPLTMRGDDAEGLVRRIELLERKLAAAEARVASLEGR